jgi:glutaredoxin-related protein
VICAKVCVVVVGATDCGSFAAFEDEIIKNKIKYKLVTKIKNIKNFYNIVGFEKH